MLIDLLTNPVLITSALAWVISQLIKCIIDFKLYRSVRLLGHGGMPSSHSATMTSLALMTGLYAGFDSVAFAIAAIVAFVVMCDAAGVRNETAKHTASIKKIAGALNSSRDGEGDGQIETDDLKDFVGHTPIQVIVGALLGLAVAFCAFAVMRFGFDSQAFCY